MPSHALRLALACGLGLLLGSALVLAMALSACAADTDAFSDLRPRDKERMQRWEKMFDMPEEERMKFLVGPGGIMPDRLSGNSLASPCCPAPREPEE